MMHTLGDRVHFLHLRNVKREDDPFPGSFQEAEHLGGDVDMVALVAAVLDEEARRRTAGGADHMIPMRPDHRQEMLGDLTRQSQPGYPQIGRVARCQSGADGDALK
ncbi:MAG: mannonate dehydratase [Paracoccaceae bacterium]|jgi:mannonate dehydratase